MGRFDATLYELLLSSFGGLRGFGVGVSVYLGWVGYKA